MTKEPTIRGDYKPPEKLYGFLKQVYQRKNDMADARVNKAGGANRETEWDKWEKQWQAYRLPKDSDDWRSNIYVPETTAIVETMLAEIVNQDLMPWVVERGAEDRPKAQIMNAILDYVWDVSKSNIALMDILKDSLIYGTGIGMEYYWKEQRDIKTPDGKTKRVTEYDNCYLEPVRLWDFYVDERARGFSGPYGANDCIRRYIMDYDDFRNFFQDKKWDPFGAAKFVKAGGDTNYYEFYKPPERLQHDKEVEVLWYWNKREDLLNIVANDVLVVSGPNPYRHKQLPFIRAVDVKIPYQFYGKGEAELIESLQEEKNTLRRMIIDRNHLDIDKPILVSDTLTLEDEDVVSRPHGLIPVGDVNAAKPLEYSDVPSSVFKSIEMLNDDRVRVTGMDERQMSVQKGTTATEAAILKEATLKRLGMKIWQIKNDTLVDLGRLRVANIMQFYSQPKLQEIVGESAIAKAEAKGLLITKGGKNYEEKYKNIRLKDERVVMDRAGQPEMMPERGYSFFEAKPEFFMPTHGGYDLQYQATSSMPISKPLEQQKADEMYDRLAGNPSVDPWKLAEYLIETRDKDPEEFKIKPPEQENKGPNLKQMVDLAGIENDEMLRGNKIGATPYASPVHTEMHIEFMKSNKFKEDVPVENEEIIQNFANHITGEIVAEQIRSGQPEGALGQEGGGEMGMPGMSQQAGSQGGTNLDMQAAMPGKIQGGGQVPSGMAGSKAGISGGRKLPR